VDFFPGGFPELFEPTRDDLELRRTTFTPEARKKKDSQPGVEPPYVKHKARVWIRGCKEYLQSSHAY